MPTSSFVLRNDHGIGVGLMADYLEISKFRFTRNHWEAVVRNARDEFIGCRRCHVDG
jgi:hypothetical protein